VFAEQGGAGTRNRLEGMYIQYVLMSRCLGQIVHRCLSREAVRYSTSNRRQERSSKATGQVSGFVVDSNLCREDGCDDRARLLTKHVIVCSSSHSIIPTLVLERAFILSQLETDSQTIWPLTISLMTMYRRAHEMTIFASDRSVNTAHELCHQQQHKYQAY